MNILRKRQTMAGRNGNSASENPLTSYIYDGQELTVTCEEKIARCNGTKNIRYA